MDSVLLDGAISTTCMSLLPSMAGTPLRELICFYPTFTIADEIVGFDITVPSILHTCWNSVMYA